MKRLAVALALVAAWGCQAIERPTYREPDPAPLQRPAPPPERILRIAPDFRFREPETGKTYFYRGYAEKLPNGGDFKHEIVTVLDPKGEYERDATEEERAYAMDVLERDWRNKGLEDQIRYHAEVARMGRERRDSLVDTKIAFSEQAVKHLEEHLVSLEADLVSSTRTPGYQAPAGHLEFLQREIAVTQGSLAETKARLEMLRYLQTSRERAYGRSGRLQAGS
ncbi:MAG TPA: hypothetical protein VFS19_06740 [Planctomycetota bacterium]|nr:hypothetical protein [Planctomycetota bacterium]